MSFRYPVLLVVAVVVCLGLLLAYRALFRSRARALAAAGLTPARRQSNAALLVRPKWRPTNVRQHVPPLLFLAALTLLLAGAARPEATVKIPRASGTVILAFDVSASMTAADANPSRLAAAQAAAVKFVKAQPDTVDIGVVAFDQGALSAHVPSKNRDDTINAINRLHAAGGTSLGQAILTSLSTITGKTVNLPDPNAAASDAPPNLGYWGSATIVLLSDGEDTGGPDALAAAQLAADAGVHVETIGFGTVDGATITVDGFQVATALDEDLLTQISQTTGGAYHRGGDAQALDQIYRSLALRMTAKPEFVELTGAVVVAAVLLVTAGGILMIIWYGRIL
jgi:Ca-activated chloride channel homolog